MQMASIYKGRVYFHFLVWIGFQYLRFCLGKGVQLHTPQNFMSLGKGMRAQFSTIASVQN